MNKTLNAMLLMTGLVIGTNAFAAGIPLPEHPRPDWERAEWLNLNGEWDFGFAAGKLDQKIVVPFGWGSKLSGVKDPDDGMKDATGFYRRAITVPAAWKGKRVFLVVGACDHDTTFRFDGKRLGAHSGGYTPFEFELTPHVKWGEKQTIDFEVWDEGNVPSRSSWRLYGKQGYGNARGIWQTVYLEARGPEPIAAVKFFPHLASGTVTAEVRLELPAVKASAAVICTDGKCTRVPFKPGELVAKTELKLDNPKLWDLENPYLYEVTVSYEGDEVKTYFGFREIGVGKMPGTGHPYVTLNGKPIYLQLTLDQSYHPDGWYTFPTDEFMKNEILISKRLALSGNRVHIKVEMPRKLYWADKLGLLIQADVPCAWGEASEAMFREHWFCFEDMVKRDFNHPCIYQWTLFNETWGLFTDGGLAGNDRAHRYAPWVRAKVAECYLKAKALDPTRIVEDQSACNHDHVVSDINTWHGYLPGYWWEAEVKRWCDQTAPGRTENYIGGLVQTDAPMMNSECGNVWGYSGSSGDVDQSWDYHWMMNAFRRNPKCAGWLYTEHHDVINEWNGYVHFDRSPKYTGMEELLPGMATKDLHAKAYLPLDVNFYKIAKPGEVWKMPVSISLTTDEYAGKAAALVRRLRWWNAKGALQEAVTTVKPALPLAAWQWGALAEDAVTLPGETAVGVVGYELTLDGKTIARNFAPFAVRDGKSAAKLTPAKAEWSVKQWDILDGRKLCGAGKGYFEFTLDAPAAGGVFRVELSSKPLNAKDKTDDGRDHTDLDCMLGGGFADRSRNPNSYPMTGDEKHPSNLKVYADGKLVKELTLANDPCDHRGLLSWMAQPHDGKLREAGTYGELVEAAIPASAVKNGKVTIRLEADQGLAVYGPEFGRYPFGPKIENR